MAFPDNRFGVYRALSIREAAQLYAARAARPKQKCRLSKAALIGILLPGYRLSTPREALEKTR
jgi:hypothetical protein